jgi:hypothetical protein
MRKALAAITFGRPGVRILVTLERFAASFIREGQRNKGARYNV